MKIKGRDISIRKVFFLIVYYSLAYYLPSSGLFNGRKIRRYCCKQLFKQCGEHVNIERRAFFGSGADICIGDYSGIGVNAVIPSNTIIGNHVMMGPNCYILSVNHNFSLIDKPMMFQGATSPAQTIIKNDVWIGRDVLMTPGGVIENGTIIAARTVLCKNFPAYSVIGGNPSKLIKSRI